MFSRITDVKLTRSPDRRCPYEVWYARRTWYGKQWLFDKFELESEAIAQFERVKNIAANPVIRSFSLPILDDKTISIQIMNNTPLTPPDESLARKLREAVRWMKKNGVRRATEV